MQVALTCFPSPEGPLFLWEQALAGSLTGLPCEKAQPSRLAPASRDDPANQCISIVHWAKRPRDGPNRVCGGGGCDADVNLSAATTRGEEAPTHNEPFQHLCSL